MRKLSLIFFALAVVFGAFPSKKAEASNAELKSYVPVLKETKDKFIPIDQAKGYAVKDLGNGVHVITDGIWQSAILVTNKGVIVFDAPESYGSKLQAIVKEITTQPIKYLVYSHAHKDHIGGSAAFSGIKGLKIVALASVKRFLEEHKDPNRLVPHVTFDQKKTIELGGTKVQLVNEGNYHSPEGDIFIYIPHAKFLMAVDTLTPGYVPFMGFDLTSNFHEYLKVFDKILKYDFKIFVGGHLTHFGGRSDVEVAKEFAFDVYRTTKRIHGEANMMQIMSKAAQDIGWDNKFLLFKAFLDHVRNLAVKELTPKWINRLAGVDVWLESHVNTALVYVRWDD